MLSRTQHTIRVQFLSLMNDLATPLISVLNWIATGVEGCQRVIEIHACKVVFMVLHETYFFNISGQQRHENEPTFGRASCFHVLIEC